MTAQPWISELPADALSVGDEFGPYRYGLESADVKRFVTTLEPGDGPADGRVPAGMMSLYFLKTAMDAFDGIPNGAILARQTYRFGAQPAAGSVLEGRLRIDDKEVRKGRTWITFTVDLAQDDAHVASSQLTWIWAR